MDYYELYGKAEAVLGRYGSAPREPGTENTVTLGDVGVISALLAVCEQVQGLRRDLDPNQED